MTTGTIKTALRIMEIIKAGFGSYICDDSITATPEFPPIFNIIKLYVVIVTAWIVNPKKDRNYLAGLED